MCLAKETVTASDFSNLVSDLRSFVAKRVSSPKKRAPADRTIDNGLCVLKHEDFFNGLKHAVIFTKQSRENAKADVDGEPVLTLETQLAGVRAVIEKMITASGLAPQLTPIYGANLFKCSQPQCDSFHEGFLTQRIRDTHQEQHDRVFTCSFAGCHSSMVGFGSMADLQKHEQQYHQGVCDGNSFPWNGTLETMDINKEIENGNYPAFELWLSQWNDSVPAFSRTGVSYFSPISSACWYGRNEMVKVLFSRASRDRRIYNVHRDILWALKCHNEEAATMLFEDLGPTTEIELYAQLTAALHSGMDSFATGKLLGHRLSTLVTRKKRKEATYLNQAILYDRHAVVEHIFNTYKVDLNQTDDKSRTPLMATAQFNRIEIATYLIETSCCEKWTKNKRGESALSIAGCQGYEAFIVSVFLEEPPAPEVQQWLGAAQFRNAARDGDGRKVTALLDQGLSRIDEVDLEHHSPWMWAVKKGHKDIVEILLKRSNISFLGQFPKQGKYGHEGPGVVHLAAYAGHESVLQVLIQNDKFPSELDRSCGWFSEIAGGTIAHGTPLEIAKAHDHLNAVKVIEDFMASLDAENAPKLDLASVQILGQQPDNSLPNDQNEIQRLRPEHSLGLPGSDQQAKIVFPLSPTSGGHLEPTATSLAESLGHEVLEGAFPPPNY